ncbi:MAG: hypothetical protein WD533_04570, partial [Dehalococcoidia bacterium]
AMKKISRLMVMGMLALALALFTAACAADDEPEPDPNGDPQPTATEPATGDPSPTEEPTAVPDDEFDAAEYFSGKTIEFVIGFAPGGGYDTYARMIAQFLPRHMPGNPDAVVTNLTGAGGMRSAQYIHEEAPPEGLHVATMHERFVATQIVGEPQDGFDGLGVEYVGAPTGAADVGDGLAITNDIATSIEDVLSWDGDPITQGATEPGHTGNGAWRLLQLLGYPVNIVYGYGGSAEVRLAIDRGEIDTLWTVGVDDVADHPDWADEMNVFVRQNFLPMLDEELEWWGLDEQPSIITEVPEIADQLSDEQARVYQLWQEFNAGRAYFIAPNTPPEIVEAWRTAMDGVAEDPEFQELAAN